VVGTLFMNSQELIQNPKIIVYSKAIDRKNIVKVTKRGFAMNYCKAGSSPAELMILISRL
jgi:hypothetical protein